MRQPTGTQPAMAAPTEQAPPGRAAVPTPVPGARTGPTPAPQARGTLISLAPAACPLPQLVRTAIDAEQVGATRIHLAADQPDVPDAVDAIRAQTRLVITSDAGTPAAAFADQPGPAFVEVLLPAGRLGPDLLTELARITTEHPAGASVAGHGDTALPLLLVALAVGLHVRVGTADEPRQADQTDLGPPTGPKDDVALVVRAAGLARIAGRPPLSALDARAALGLS